jgi:hypothetical protein
MALERLIYNPPSTSPRLEAEIEPNPEYKKEPAQADALYDLLARRDCCTAEHKALLKLSDFRFSVKGTIVYDMFLSCCSHAPVPENSSWHSTTCLFERFVTRVWVPIRGV